MAIGCCRLSKVLVLRTLLRNVVLLSSYPLNIVHSIRPHVPEDPVLLITPLHAADSTLHQLPDCAACALFVQIIAFCQQSAFGAFEK